jgi:Catalytic LigB subunit of aromatic ring-opening dioxygenase
MAEIIMGVGTSHTPLLAIEPKKWNEYIARDYTRDNLNLSDGRWVSYDQLNQMRNGRYADITDVETFVRKSDICQRALDRLGDDIAAADPDVIVIVTDDETELFDRMNTPAVSIYYGDDIITHPRKRPEPMPSYMARMLEIYGMDEPHTFPAMAGFARELIERFIDHDIDIGAAAQVQDPYKSGFGHGVGFVETRIFRDKKIPVIPLLLNTYYPPNAPRAARCHDIGRVLRKCIEASKEKLRVAVMASGGLSHFIVDEELDRRVLEGFRQGKADLLRTLPAQALNSGSSEIRNWIAVAGVVEGMESRWLEYQPLYRTPAGTGIGVAFGIWS